MTTYLATTRCALLRGVTLDHGDEVDANAGSPVAGWADWPAGLIEKTRQTFDPATGTRRTVRWLACRAPANMVVQDGDRVRDNRTGTIYAVNESVAVARTLSGQSSLTLDLRKLA